MCSIKYDHLWPKKFWITEKLCQNCKDGRYQNVTHILIPAILSCSLTCSRLLKPEKKWQDNIANAKIRPLCCNKSLYYRTNLQASKKSRSEDDSQLDESTDKTLFALLKLPSKVVEKPPKPVDSEKLTTFSNLLQKFTAEHSVETVSTYGISYSCGGLEHHHESLVQNSQ